PTWTAFDTAGGMAMSSSLAGVDPGGSRVATYVSPGTSGASGGITADDTEPVAQSTVASAAARHSRDPGTFVVAPWASPTRLPGATALMTLEKVTTSGPCRGSVVAPPGPLSVRETAASSTGSGFDVASGARSPSRSAGDVPAGAPVGFSEAV